MRQIGLFAFFILFFSLPAIGQSEGYQGSQGDLLDRLLDDGANGQIKVTADSLLIVNYHKHIAENQKISGIPGFRIRIFSDSGIGAKEEQQRIRARFLSLYPETDAYYHYDEPFFKVYVGDFRTESEALKLFDQIKRNFPNSILGSSQINIKSVE